MEAKDILNSELTQNEKIDLLWKPRDKGLTGFIEYYNGIQDIRNRHHPTDRSKDKDLNKLVINVVSKIVNYHADFTFSKPQVLTNGTEDTVSFEKFMLNWTDAKLTGHYQQMARELLAYGEVAEIIYRKAGNKVRNKMVSVTNNKISANFNAQGDLDCFIRKFNTTEFIGNKEKEVQNIEVYTETYVDKYTEIDGVLSDPITTDYKEMPIIYYQIKEPIWLKIKGIQDRININKSVNADVIDIYSYPILILWGLMVENEKGETTLDTFAKGKTFAKMLQMDTSKDGKSDATLLQQKGADASYLAEYESILSTALYLTSTPNISFDNLKGIGSLSGVALKLMFTESLTESASLQNAFFGLSRTVNLHKAQLSEINGNKEIASLIITVTFQNSIPTNEKELIENIKTALDGGFISVETAVSINPLVTNTEVELERIQNEKTKDLAESYI